MKQNNQGFTLVEVAIALVIVGLLMAGGMSLLSSSSDVARYKATQNSLNEIKQALQGYYVLNQRLPCPDTDVINAEGFGLENPVNGGVCTSTVGWLPHLTLGVGGGGDAWGERFKYVVTSDTSSFFTTKAPNCTYTRPAASATTITINDLAGQPVAQFAGFAVISTGKNGRQTNSGMSGAFTDDGGCAALNERERENCNAGLTLRSGTPMSDGNTVVFDDMLVWMGDMQLINQLVKAGCGTSTSNSTNGATPTGYDPTSRTDHNFTADSGMQFNSDVNKSEAQIINDKTSSSSDKVIIGNDLNRDINLEGGNNTLSIGGNANGEIQSGSGDDIVRINKDLNDDIDLGDGKNYLEIFGNANNNIKTGSGDDSVRIEGVANQSIDLGAGVNQIYVNDINDSIKSTGGSLTVYYNKSSIESWRKNKIQDGAEVLCNVNNEWKACNIS